MSDFKSIVNCYLFVINSSVKCLGIANVFSCGTHLFFVKTVLISGVFRKGRYRQSWAIFFGKDLLCLLENPFFDVHHIRILLKKIPVDREGGLTHNSWLRHRLYVFFPRVQFIKLNDFIFYSEVLQFTFYVIKINN